MTWLLRADTGSQCGRHPKLRFVCDQHQKNRVTKVTTVKVPYNDPLGYADLILNGDPEEYLRNVVGSHGLED